MFETNEGMTDRIARIAIGITFLAAGVYFGWMTLLGIISVVIGAIFFVTGLTGFCLIYKLFGVSTVEKKSAKAPAKKSTKKKASKKKRKR